MARKPADKPSKKPFISKADRPEVRLKSDTPLSSLTVRDLATILGQLGTGKDFWDGKDWQKDDFDGPSNKWKEIKEFKEGKEVKDKDKEFKDGKEKREIKELKAEKLELDGVFDPASQARPAHRAGDPRALRHVGQGRPARRPGRGAEKGQGQALIAGDPWFHRAPPVRMSPAGREALRALRTRRCDRPRPGAWHPLPRDPARHRRACAACRRTGACASR